VLLLRLERYAEIAEKTAVDVSVLRIRSGLQLQLALASMKGRSLDYARWPRGNPFELAQMFPPNYLGELDPEDLAALPAGNWYFDRRNVELVYLVNRSGHFSGGTDPVPAIRYRLDPGQRIGRSYPDAKLVAAAPYRWEPEVR